MWGSLGWLAHPCTEILQLLSLVKHLAETAVKAKEVYIESLKLKVEATESDLHPFITYYFQEYLLSLLSSLWHYNQYFNYYSL